MKINDIQKNREEKVSALNDTYENLLNETKELEGVTQQLEFLMQQVEEHQDQIGLEKVAEAKKTAEEIIQIIEQASGCIHNFSTIVQFKIERLDKAIENAKDDVEKYSLIMVKMGFPPHYSIQIQKIREIVKYYEVHTEEETFVFIKNLFIDLFNDKEIDGIENKWSSCEWLQPRLPILKEALSAHLTGHFYLSTVAIIPQYEGIVAEYYTHSGHLKQAKLAKYINDLLLEEGPFSMDKTIAHFYAEVILENFVHGQLIKERINRHAILHGAHINYGTKINSICSIILLDYLINKINNDTNK